MKRYLTIALLLVLACAAQAARGNEGDRHSGPASQGLRDSYDPRADGHRSSQQAAPRQAGPRQAGPGYEQRPGRDYEWRPHPDHRQPPPSPGYPDNRYGGAAGERRYHLEGGGYESYQRYENREVYRVQGGGSFERSTLVPGDNRPQRGVNEIIDMVERRYGGKVVGVEGAGDHYRVRLLQRDGRVRTLQVPAGGY